MIMNVERVFQESYHLSVVVGGARLYFNSTGCRGGLSVIKFAFFKFIADSCPLVFLVDENWGCFFAVWHFCIAKL